MVDPASQDRARRAGRRLRLVIIATSGAAALIIGSVAAHQSTTPSTAPPPSSPALVPAAPQVRGDPAAEAALATRPMMALPPEAAQPAPIAATAPSAITLPRPATQDGRITAGFPPTPQGALAQLVALNTTGMAGGDPGTYARAVAELALPDMPPVEQSGLWTLLTEFRRSAELDPGETPAGLEVRYEITHGQIKGVTHDGRYVVACTLGRFSAYLQGQGSTVGVGDCQAMRWYGGVWRISPGPRAAYAPSAWPGSTPSAEAGYHPLSGGEPA